MMSWWFSLKEIRTCSSYQIQHFLIRLNPHSSEDRTFLNYSTQHLETDINSIHADNKWWKITFLHYMWIKISYINQTLNAWAQLPDGLNWASVTKLQGLLSDNTGCQWQELLYQISFAIFKIAIMMNVRTRRHFSHWEIFAEHLKREQMAEQW